MIQIYEASNIDFASNGDMTLTPSKAEIHVILNGAWTASLSHPIDQDGRWKYIEENAVVKMPSFLEADQLFRVKKRTISDSGVDAELEPIFYDSIGDCFLVDVRPTDDNGQQALDVMTAVNSKYSGSSNITKISTAYYQFKNLMEAINGEDDNAFVKRWGGEILFDNFEVIVDEQVGADHGVELRYGKNLPTDGLTEDVDMTEVVTRIYPKAYNGYTMTNNGYVDSDLIDNYPTVLAKTITFDDVKMAEDAQEDDEENGVIVCQNQTELDAALTQRCQEQYAAGLDKPKVTLTADMVLLQNTEQYKDFQMLERVSLGDTIHCYHKKLGITTEARAIELTYDAIRKKTSAVVLGDFEYNYFSNVSSTVNRVETAIRPDGSVVAEQIQGFINGAKSQLRLQNTIAEKQNVRAVLFEDLDPDSPTFGAMALGTQGLQISRQRTADGRDWNWTTAMTAEGLIANVVIAGILADKTGNNYWNLDTGEFRLASTATVGGDSIATSTELEDAVNDVEKDITDLDDSLDQQNIFNRLTNNGQTQGIYLRDGKLYLNGEYMQIGKISDHNGESYWDLDTGELNFSGTFNMTGGQISISANNDNNLILLDGIGTGNEAVRCRISPGQVSVSNLEQRITCMIQGHGMFMKKDTNADGSGGTTIFVAGKTGVRVGNGDNGTAIFTAGQSGVWMGEIPTIVGGYTGRFGPVGGYYFTFQNGICTSIAN